MSGRQHTIAAMKALSSRIICLAVFAVIPAAIGQERVETRPLSLRDAHRLVMQTTFRIEEVSARPIKNTGSAFIVENRQESGRTAYLVTARHVLEQMPSDVTAITVHARGTRDGGQTFITVPLALPIRSKQKALWTGHPSGDVAAIRLAGDLAKLPAIPLDLLIKDRQYEEWQLGLGDQVILLGFPAGWEASNPGEGAFPMFRTARIGSYAITPTRKTKKMHLDALVFGGNSGGPVYLLQDNRSPYPGVLTANRTFAILGLVVEEVLSSQVAQTRYAVHVDRQPLAVAEVVHASLIEETVAMTP